MKCLSLSLLILSLVGCATSYQGSGAFSITGGYYEVPVNPQLTKVVFSGNGYIDTETAAKYTLFRCAELAKKQNKNYFVIYESLHLAALDQPTQQISLGAVGGETGYSYLSQAVRFKN